MEFKLRISMDNDAFVECPEVELARILDQVAAQLYNGAGKCRDLNGNTVGSWEVTDND
jgi:hypothetical protein